MFSESNFDLEFDDDFSPSIFNTAFNEETKSQSQKSENKETPKSDNDELPFIVTNKLFNSQISGINSPNKTSVNKKSNYSVPSCSFNIKRASLPDEKPNKRLSHQGLMQRKFPGPAGLLPDKPFRQIEDISLITEKTNDEVYEEGKNDSIIYSQSSGSVFIESAYQKLVSDFDLNDSRSPLSKYTIEWVKKTAVNKTLLGKKIPFLAVILHCINNSSPDPVLVLRDPTGEIKGTLHREVWIDMGGKLKTGIALALRQVGVLITGVIRRQIYLNITMNNILAIYGTSENGNDVEITEINKLTKAELFKSIEGWQQQARKSKPEIKRPPNSLFSDVDDFPSPGKSFCVSSNNNEEMKNLKNKLRNVVDNDEKETKKLKVRVEGEKKSTDEVLANLGIVFSDGDFSDDMNVPNNFLPETNHPQPDKTSKGERNESVQPKPGSFPVEESSQVLSQAESLIFQEVLSGIDLDLEFEM